MSGAEAQPDRDVERSVGDSSGLPWAGTTPAGGGGVGRGPV